MRKFITVVILCGLSPMALGADWSSSNLQLLRGSSYELGEQDRTLLTFEHANGWRYGDSFFFLDVTNPEGTNTSHYAEFSPRLSLNKLRDAAPGKGLIKEVLIAGTLEMGQDLNAQLLGLGFSLNLPGFRYANINLYGRESRRDWVSEQTGRGGQVTVTWKYPFSVSRTHWSFGGFLDYAFGEKDGSHPKTNNIIAAPQLLIDIGQLWDTPGMLEVGVEHQLWRNKFGVDGVNENVTQAMMKWIF